MESDGVKIVSHLVDSKTQSVYYLNMSLFASAGLIPRRILLFSLLARCYHTDLCLAGISVQVVCRRQVDHSKCHMNHSPSFDRNIFRRTIKNVRFRNLSFDIYLKNHNVTVYKCQMRIKLYSYLYKYQMNGCFLWYLGFWKGRGQVRCLPRQKLTAVMNWDIAEFESNSSQLYLGVFCPEQLKLVT